MAGRGFPKNPAGSTKLPPLKTMGRRPAGVQAERDISMAPTQSVSARPPTEMGKVAKFGAKHEVAGGARKPAGRGKA